jgi:6-phosphogluconolactonase
MKHQIEICPDPGQLAVTAVDRILDAAADAIGKRGRFMLALTGGSTPDKTYALLAQPQRAKRIDWSRTNLFWGDERFVPHDDPRSNYNMARRSLLAPAEIPPDHIFPIPTDTTPVTAAAAYEKTLRQAFGSAGAELPRFDLLLLGMGDDGHTASLFPGKPALHETRAWVTWSPPGVLPPPVDRVTLTFPVLNAARRVMFLVAGAAKAAALREVLAGKANVEQRPAAGVRPTDGTVLWLLDKAAAPS